MPAPSVFSRTSSKLSKTIKKISTLGKRSKPSSDPKLPKLSDAQKIKADKEQKDKEAETKSIAESIREEEEAAAEVKNVPPPQTKPTPRSSKPSQPTFSSYPQPSTSMIRPAPHTAIWNLEESDAVYPIRNYANSFYVPNFISMFETINQAHRIMASNPYIRKVQPEYLPLAFNAYISIIVHLRIYKVNQFMGTNPTITQQFLNRFEKTFRVDELPVPTILIPWIEALCANELEDGRLKWLIPFLPAALGPTAAQNIDTLTSAFETSPLPITGLSGVNILTGIPCVPLLLDWLIHYARAEDIDATVVQTVAANGPPAVAEVRIPKHERNGLFIPFSTEVDGAVPAPDRRNQCLAARNIDVTGATNHEHAQLILNALGTSGPAGFEFERYKKAHTFWKTSSFYHAFPTPTTNNTDLSTPERYMRMDVSKSWFQDLIEQCSIFCKYMGGSVPMGSLTLSNTPVNNIFTDVDFNTTGARPTIPRTDYQFHVPLTHDASCSSHIFESDVAERDSFMARHLLLNSRVSIHYTDENGAAQVHRTFTAADGVRLGPFFNRKVEAGVIANETNTITSKFAMSQNTPCMIGRTDMLRTLYYNANPDRI